MSTINSNTDMGTIVTGPPMTVSNALIGHFVATQWFDKSGRGHKEVFFVMGGTVYRDPRGESWASSLKEASPFISEAVKTQMDNNLREQILSVLKEVGVDTSSLHTEADAIADDIDAEAIAG